MNQIGQSLLPIATASQTADGPETPGGFLPASEGIFAALLLLYCEHPVPGREEVAVIAPDGGEDASEARVSSDLIAMFALPSIVPLPAPIQPQPLEGEKTQATSDVGPTDRLRILPENRAPVVAQTAEFNTAAPFPATPRKAMSVPTREVATKPQIQETPLPEPAAPMLHIANVRGIIPPMQNALAIAAEPSTRQTLAPTASVPTASVPTEATPAITRKSNGDREPAIPAVIPESAPAIFSQKAESSIPDVIKIPAPPTPTSSVAAGPTQVSEEMTPVSTVANFGGMVAANPGRDMSSPTPPRLQNPKAATPAELSGKEAARISVPSGESPSLRNTPVFATENARERFANNHSETTERPLISVPDILPTPFSSEPTPTIKATTSTAPILPSDVIKVVHHTLTATEQLRTSGQERMEVAVKLEGGQELTIRLHMANGEVTPIIRTESESLRVALEENWSLFTQRSGDRELQISRPVFESPQTSSNMSDPNQQRDGRQRAFQEPAPAFAQPYLSRRPSTPGNPKPISTTSAPPNGVRLYA